jgi:hypothetical protein
MGKQKSEPKPEDLDPLRERIRAWRSTRRRPNPMPGEIWNHAVVLARQFGVCKVARAVGLDYTALRKKVATAKELPGLVLPTFVELPGTLFAEEAQAVQLQETAAAALPGGAGTLIDIATPDGVRIRIQLEAGRGIEAAGIVAAFMEGRR